MTISRDLKEGILEANNEAESRTVSSDYTIFNLGEGKARYPTGAVRGVVEYLSGKLPRDEIPEFSISNKLHQIKDAYEKIKSPLKDVVEDIREYHQRRN